ncbi:MAG: polysaccharide deacetylase family protein [Deltaproteobacteria bacterium]|nr:polysaccharide deacetylase family protein [Deltaproteobacteria bacterium]
MTNEMVPARILFLIDELETWGGAERHLYELCRSLDRAQFLPEIAVLHGARQVERFRGVGLPVHELDVTRIYGATGIRALMRLTSHLLRSETRLLVTYHTAADLLGPLGAAAAGVPALSSRRDVGFTKKPSHVKAQRRVNRGVAAIIAVADAVRRAVIESEGYPASRIHVIHNGVDTDRYAPRPSPLRAELGIGPDEVLVGTLANFDPVKGYDVLAPAVERLRARVPARVVLFGEGPLLDEMRRRLAPLGGRVLLPGARRDVEHILWALDVFVLASHTEGLSNAILEALAAGRTICATRVGGNPELIDEGSGVLVPPGQPAALAEALEALCRDPGRRLALGAAARARAVASFSHAGMVRRYEEVFHLAIEEAPGRTTRRLAKQAVAHAWSGAAPARRVSRRAAWLARCYHRVTPTVSGWDPALTVSADTFRRQLRALAEDYDLVTCGQLQRALAAGERRRLCAVSFDDGYADNLEVALPILQEASAPWTIFVATDPVDRGVALWFERLAVLLRRHLGCPDFARVCAEHAPLRALPALVAGAATPREAVRLAVAALKDLPTHVREETEAWLVAEYGPPEAAALPRFLDWDGVRRLDAAGAEIGGHTLSHPILPRTKAARAREEIAEGRARLEAALGHAVAGFAYPNGDHDSVAVRLVREAGFSWAFTAAPGPWDGDPFRIPRRVVAEQASRGYVAPFSAAAFLAEVEGAYDRLRR